MNWCNAQAMSAGGGAVITINGGRFVCTGATSTSDLLKIGYVRSQNAGITFENQIAFNGGECVLAGFRNNSCSATASKKVKLAFNGGMLTALFTTTAFNVNQDSYATFDQVDAEVGKGGLVFNTSGHDVTWNGIALVGEGGLVKRGAGTLTLTAACSYTGTNRVAAGTLVLSAANAATCLAVASGATAQIADPAYFAQDAALESGATLAFAGSTLSLARLAAKDGILQLTPAAEDAGQRIAATSLDADASLRFALVDANGADWTANGTYTLLTAPGLDATQCRIANPAAGKTYAFNVSENVLSVTVADGTDATTRVVAESTTWNEALEVADTLYIRLLNGVTLTLAGQVTGAGRLVVSGEGTLAITGGCAVPVAAEGVTVSIGTAEDLAAGLALGAGATLRATGDLVYAGAVTVAGAAQLEAPEGVTFALTGAIGGSGSLALAGDGVVKVTDASALEGGLVLAGTAECTTLPTEPAVFDGGTLRYTGASKGTLDVPIVVKKESDNGGAFELAPGAGDVEAWGPFVFDSRLYFWFRTAPENELAFRGGAWAFSGATDGTQDYRALRLGAGNFRFASDANLNLTSQNDGSLRVGEPGQTGEAETTLTIDEGAYVRIQNLQISPSTASQGGSGVAVKQQGGRVELTSTFGWGSDSQRFAPGSYSVAGGTFVQPSSRWCNFKWGDTTFAVSGGSATLGNVSFGIENRSWEGCVPTYWRPDGYHNTLRVTGGMLSVTGDFDWFADTDRTLRHVRVEVDGTGTLAIPATRRAVVQEATSPIANTVLRLSGGTLELTGPRDGSSADDYLYGLDDWTLGTNRATIATATDATISQRLRAVSSTGGTLVKDGAGALTLAAPDNVVFGGVDVKAGTLTAALDAAEQTGYPDSLVALWDFDGAEPFKDKTGHGYDLVQLHEAQDKLVAVTNGDDTIGLAHAGTCAYWPACGASLAMTNGVAFNWTSHTVNFWTKLTSFNEDRGLVSFFSTRSSTAGKILNNTWCICLKGKESDESFRFDGDPYAYPGVSCADAIKYFTKGAWHMITTVRAGTNAWEYIDGVAVTPYGNIDASYATSPFKVASAMLSIGQTYGAMNENNGNEYMNRGGMMDDISIYSRALTADEVATLYAQQRVAPTPDVTVAAGATWNMNGSSVTTHRLAGAGTVTDGTLTLDGTLVFDPSATVPIHVAQPAFAETPVTVDLGCTEEAPIPYGTYTLMTFDAIDDASAARVPHWKLTNSGRTRNYAKTFTVDASAQALRLEVTSGGLVFLFR